MTYEELSIEERARLQQTGQQQGLNGAQVMEFYNNPEEYGFYNLPEIEVTPQTNNSDRTYAILKSMSNNKEQLGRLYNIFIETFDNPTSDDTNIGFSRRMKRLGEVWDLAKRPKIIDTGNDWFENIANHFTTGFEKVPKYDNFGNTVILHDKGKAIIDELSHALQYKAFPNLKGEWSWSNFQLKRQKQLESYEKKGNIENVAHTVIQPVISNYIYSGNLPSNTHYKFLSNGRTPLEFMIDGFKELSKEKKYKWRKPTKEERRQYYDKKYNR